MAEVTLTESNASEEVEKRILVLGSAPHTHLVRAYNWDSLPQPPLLNVADYDVVILDFVPLLNNEFAKGIDLNALPTWQQFARLVFSQGSEVIAIGLPGIKIGGNPFQYTTWWLPIVPHHIDELGDEVREIEPEFAFYFQHVHKWFFHMYPEWSEDPRKRAAYLSAVHPQADQLVGNIRPIAQTRFQRAIAFELQFRVMATRLIESIESGRIIWLPPTTEISHYEAVDLILRERYGLCLEQAPPSWVQVFKLPAQLPIEIEIAKLEQGIQRLTMELITARQRFEEATCFCKLLYEQGEDVLEPVVRDALRELGAQVRDPKQRGREDGRLVAPSGRNGMLEIKGRTGALKADDVRQLRQWVDDAVIKEDWRSKGILIANLRCGDPPGQRDKLFPDNQVRAAENFGQCLLTTTQLFSALCSYQCGELDVDEFWDTVFNTNGVCPLPELEPPEKGSS